MNSSSSDSKEASDTSNGNGAVGGFGYGIGVSLALVLILVIVTYASYMCRRPVSGGNTAPNHHFFDPRRSSIDTSTDDDSSVVVIHGLDEATLSSYPKFIYSQLEAAQKSSDSAASAGCSICLADYRDADLLRLLPDCGHLFHLKCVDPWLMLHPTCPICRSSPLPTPLPAPPAPPTTLSDDT